MALIHGIVENCTNNGDFYRQSYDTGTAEFQSYGGIVGANTGKILRCSNNGNIEANHGTSYYNYEYMGGICGCANGSIINCVNNGNVTATRAGGLCGGTYYKKTSDVPENANTDLYILNCKNTGEMTSYNYGGTRSYGRKASFMASVAVGKIYIRNCYDPIEKYGEGMVFYDGDPYGDKIKVEASVYVENCYGIGSGIYSSSAGIYSNVYTTDNTSYTVDGVSYGNSEEYMKSQEFCDKLNNNQLTDTGEPIFKYIDGQYPALYWEE